MKEYLVDEPEFTLVLIWNDITVLTKIHEKWLHGFGASAIEVLSYELVRLYVRLRRKIMAKGKKK